MLMFFLKKIILIIFRMKMEIVILMVAISELIQILKILEKK